MIAKAKNERKEGQPLVTEPMLELGSYDGHLEYRASVGNAAVHEKEAEMFYVIDGSATLVTGGKLVNEKRTDAADLNGSGSRAGVRAPWPRAISFSCRRIRLIGSARSMARWCSSPCMCRARDGGPEEPNDFLSSESVWPASIGRRPLQMVDDQHINRACSRFELQAKLLLERLHGGGPRDVGNEVRAGGDGAIGAGHILDDEVECSGKPGLVENGAVGIFQWRQQLRDPCYGHVARPRRMRPRAPGFIRTSAPHV